MKTLITFISIALLLALPVCMHSQVPDGINYQSVVRNAQGEIHANANATFFFTISNAGNNTLLYSEMHETTSNLFGLVNLVIGNGTPIIGSFENLTWDIPYSLSTSVLIDGVTTDMGNTALQSVPYALNAGSASTLLPSATVSPLQLTAEGATTNQVLQFDGTNWIPATINVNNGGNGTFDLPYAETDTYDQALLNVTNTNWNAIEGFSTNGMGLYGSSVNNDGVAGITMGLNNAGVSGMNYENGPGVYGHSSTGHGIIGNSGSSSSAIYGVNNHGEAIRGHADQEGIASIVGYNEAENSIGIMGISHCEDCAAFEAYTQNGTGFKANSARIGADIYATEKGVDVSTHSGIAVDAYASPGTAVKAVAESGTGVYAKSYTGVALETDGKVKIAGAGQSPAQGKVLTSDANGNATWQGAVVFAVQNGGNQFLNETESEKVMFTTEDYDFGNNYDMTTRVFTVPVHGIYHFDAQLAFGYTSDDFLGRLHLELERNGVVWSPIYNTEQEYDTNGSPNISFSCEFELLPGDKIWLSVFQHGSDDLTIDDYGDTRFSGRLVLSL